MCPYLYFNMALWNVWGWGQSKFLYGTQYFLAVSLKSDCLFREEVVLERLKLMTGIPLINIGYIIRTCTSQLYYIIIYFLVQHVPSFEISGKKNNNRGLEMKCNIIFLWCPKMTEPWQNLFDHMVINEIHLSCHMNNSSLFILRPPPKCCKNISTVVSVLSSHPRLTCIHLNT